MFICKTNSQYFHIDFEKLTFHMGYMIAPVTKDYIFTTPKEMSATLRDEMGLELAQEALHKAGIPHDSALWSLNHHNVIPSNDILDSLNNLEIIEIT